MATTNLPKDLRSTSSGIRPASLPPAGLPATAVASPQWMLTLER